MLEIPALGELCQPLGLPVLGVGEAGPWACWSAILPNQLGEFQASERCCFKDKEEWWSAHTHTHVPCYVAPKVLRSYPVLVSSVANVIMPGFVLFHISQGVSYPTALPFRDVRC